MSSTEINKLTEEIIGAAIEVHRLLGPGLLEHTYQAALTEELSLRGLHAEKEVDIPFFYKGVRLDTAYRADIVVENAVILELKATEIDNPLHLKQLMTYIRLADMRVGILINFNREKLVDGLHRVVNKL